MYPCNQVLLHLSQFCTSTEKFSLHGKSDSIVFVQHTIRSTFVWQVCAAYYTQYFCMAGLMPSMTECGEDLSSYISRTRGCLEEAVEAILKNSSQSLVSLSFTECNLMITERWEIHHITHTHTHTQMYFNPLHTRTEFSG